MAHRVALRAEIDLDDIWYYVAKESSSIEIADHLVDSITNRFFLLAKYPYLGRSRDHEFGSGIRSFPSGNTSSSTPSKVLMSSSFVSSMAIETLMPYSELSLPDVLSPILVRLKSMRKFQL